MNRKIVNWVAPPLLFFIAEFIYVVVLRGPFGLTQLLVLAGVILAGWFLANRLRKPSNIERSA
jgi:hypothetical protein